MVRHPKMRPKDGFRDSIFPLKLCAKFLSTYIFSGKNVKGFTSDIQRDSFPKKYQITRESTYYLFIVNMRTNFYYCAYYVLGFILGALFLTP